MASGAHGRRVRTLGRPGPIGTGVGRLGRRVPALGLGITLLVFSSICAKLLRKWAHVCSHTHTHAPV